MSMKDQSHTFRVELNIANMSDMPLEENNNYIKGLIAKKLSVAPLMISKWTRKDSSPMLNNAIFEVELSRYINRGYVQYVKDRYNQQSQSYGGYSSQVFSSGDYFTQSYTNVPQSQPGKKEEDQKKGGTITLVTRTKRAINV